MACLHREDFRSVNGFDGLREDGWGGEDLFLLRKFARSSTVQVFRSITPGLFHMYHSKECDQDQLTQRQYTDCLTAKVFNEASHRDFGLLYFNSISNKTQSIDDWFLIYMFNYPNKSGLTFFNYLNFRNKFFIKKKTKIIRLISNNLDLKNNSSS